MVGLAGAVPTVPVLPPTYATDGADVRRLATHVLARARFQAVGRIGLVPTPDGIGTPAFGADATVVRLTPATLVVERAGDVRTTPLAGATLRSLAAAAGADLAAELSVGADTPELGEVDEPLAIDPASIRAIGTWQALGWAAIDAVVGGLGPDATPARTQLWPEHFDAGTSVALGPADGDRTNLGAANGDAWSAEPYLYVAPWGPQRPGDAAYWNAPFGAALGLADLATAADPLAAGVAFLRAGLARLSPST